jgi:hypothetical protein
VTGVPDSLYGAARRVLLDALEALREQGDAIVLVGAQAVYVHTGTGDLTVPPHTTDGDIVLDPYRLLPEPRIEDVLRGAGFSSSSVAVGAWEKAIVVDGVPRIVAVDILVPETLGGRGRRAARIPPHEQGAARKADGLEGCLIDRSPHRIVALEPEDPREFEVSVAGPSALLVAKIHKIGDRASDPDRQTDKDALDLLRLLRSVPTAELVGRLRLLQASEISAEVTRRALEQLPRLFGTPRAIGCVMAARASAPLEPESVITASAAALAGDLIAAMEVRGP